MVEDDDSTVRSPVFFMAVSRLYGVLCICKTQCLYRYLYVKMTPCLFLPDKNVLLCLSANMIGTGTVAPSYSLARLSFDFRSILEATTS
jgi:hypothetical protein